MGHPKLHVLPVVSDEPAVFAPSRTLVDLGVTPVAQCLGSHLEHRGDLPLGEKGLHVIAFPTSPRAVGLVMRSDETTRSGCVFRQAMSRYVPRQGSLALVVDFSFRCKYVVRDTRRLEEVVAG